MTPKRVPASVLLIGSAPHDKLFPMCSAVVHHGGAGTTAAGLRAGKPTVIVPFFGKLMITNKLSHAQAIILFFFTFLSSHSFFFGFLIVHASSLFAVFCSFSCLSLFFVHCAWPYRPLVCSSVPLLLLLLWLLVP